MYKVLRKSKESEAPYRFATIVARRVSTFTSETLYRVAKRDHEP